MMKLELLPSYDVLCIPRLGLFDRLFQEWTDPPLFVGECESWMPPSDISQTSDEYIITSELPGMDLSSLDVSYAEGVLTIQGEKKKDLFKEGESCNCSERFSGLFQRNFRIGGGIKEDEIDATYKDGVLRLVIPKSEESRVKKIEVKH
jgi:HSP20 family protein